MTAESMVAWAGVRARWRSWLLLGVLVAMAGGAVISFAAAAQRTDSSYSRFLRAERAADVIIFITGTGRERPQAFEHLPEVAASAVSVDLAPSGTDFTPVVLIDNRLGRSVNRFKLLSGRLPRTASETTVGFVFASDRHLQVGSRLSLSSSGATTALTVVGIEAAPGEFPPLSYANQQIAYLSKQFLHTPMGMRWEKLSGGAVALAVRLHGGTHDVARFLADVDRIAGQPVGTATPGDQATQVQDSMHLQALALWLMAGFAAVAAALVLTQLFLREVGEEAPDHLGLRSMGMTSWNLFLCLFIRFAAIVFVGAIGAVVVAFAMSPLFPLGTAGIAEPHPGPAFEPLSYCLGSAAVVILLCGVAAAVSWRATRHSSMVGSARNENDGAPWVRRALKLGMLPIGVTTGLRMALTPGKGQSAVPVRSTLAAAVIAVGAMTTAVTFGSSLGHLLATPRLYGTTYDADVELNANFGDIRSVVPVLKADPSVAALSVAMSGVPLWSSHRPFGALATSDVIGSVEPTVVEGRLPRAGHEIALGSRTMSDLRTGVGQTIPVAVEGLTRSIPMHVVGQVVLAPVSDTQSLGHGAVISLRALRVFAAAIRNRSAFQVPPPGDALVRFTSRTSQTAAISDLEHRLGGPNKVLVTPVTQPADVVNFGQVRDLPQILAALLGVLAATTLGHLLVSAISRRRRELAVLKALGLVPRQISAAIAWQATAIAAIALALGVPLGLAAGRALWSAVGHNIGVIVEPTIPWVWVGFLVPATLVLANLVAAVPAASAARIAPAAVLRSE